MKKVDKKYKDLVEEFKWRFKASGYKEDDKAQVCMHETIDKDVSFISIADVEALANELGTIKILDLEKDYVDSFGEIDKTKTGDKRLRVILYWYFESRMLDDVEISQYIENEKVV